ISGTTQTTLRTQLYGAPIPDATSGTIRVCFSFVPNPTAGSILEAVVFSGVNKTNSIGSMAGHQVHTDTTTTISGDSITNSTTDVLVDVMMYNVGTAPVAAGTSQTAINTGTYTGGPPNYGWGMSNKTGGSTGFFKWTVSATSHDGEEMGAALHGLSYTLYETVTATDSVI